MIAAAAFLAGAAGVALATGAVPGAAGVSDGERAKIEAIVRDYILGHPEIIPEAMEKLEARQAATAIDSVRTQIETPFAGAWAGNEKGSATLVVFFDYACGFCRKSLPDIERLLTEDKDLKIVFRELPILSEDSEMAARVSLAAAKQGKFKAFHDALYAAGPVTPDSLEAAATSAGVNMDKAGAMAARADAEIAANTAIAQQLGMTGTPSWIIGDKVVSAALPLEELEKAVKEARDRS